MSRYLSSFIVASMAVGAACEPVRPVSPSGVVSSASPEVRLLKEPARVTALAVPASPDGCLSISYTLQQPDGERADVVVEVDAQGDGSFQRVTQAGSTDHEGLLARATSPEGVAHRFLWNRAVDVRAATSVNVRVSAQVPGAALDSRTVALALPAPGRGCDVWMDSSRVTSMQKDMPRLATSGDFDRDGKLDLILVMDYGPMLMMKGLGNGGFLPAVPLVLGFNLPDDAPPVAADLDGDGVLDLLWTRSYEQILFVARGLGDGSFAPVIQYGVQAGMQAGLLSAGGKSSLVVADFDGNGSPDVALKKGYSSLVLFLNQGDGTLSAVLPPGTYWPFTSRLATADLDEDGHQDLVATSYGRPFVVLLSNGDGTFRTQQQTGDVWMLDSALRDFDEDGHVDQVIAVPGSSTTELRLRRGNGQGGFSAAALVASVPGAPNPSGPTLLEADDLDGDGHLDLAVTIEQEQNAGREVRNTLNLVKGLGDGTFAPVVRLPSGRRPSFVTTGDFDGNGVSDVVTLQWETKDVRVWLGGPGRTTRTLPIGSEGLSAVGDFNGDGWTDVISTTGYSTTQVKMSLGGPGGLSNPGLVTTLNSATVALQVVHVDVGTTLDVVLYSSSGLVQLLLGNGDGTLRPAVALPLGSLVEHVESGDVNGDGKPDLVFIAGREASSGREARLLIGRGDGTFEPPVSLATGSLLRQAVLADLDRDGKLDVMVLRSGTGVGAEVLMGRGDGTFTPGPGLSLGDDAMTGQLRLADLDQDGVLDAVYCRDVYEQPKVKYSLQVLKGTGTGEFTRLGSYSTQGNCTTLTLADVDADGWWDVLSSNLNAGSVSVLRGVGQGVLAPDQCFGSYDSDSSYDTPHLSVLDANGDGRLDLLSGTGLLGRNALLLQR
ncbi:FG-GAP repeat domain-containing protein [Cystobacter fuscus]|uniref:FG-GAP repeat domain-containing protein n=1 Tax=Cystobacter fuscus TaxID=43 RepID=UPI0002AE5A4A|nr:VCBS repeat-containing protein [Cystobacter fuscus]